MEQPQVQRLRLDVVTESKRALLRIVSLGALVLVVLPFWTTFQDVLTRVVMGVGWYKSIQSAIVPYELRVVGSVLTLMGLPIRVGQAYLEWSKAGGSTEVIYLQWNCVGWQTVVLFGVTLVSGLAGRYSLPSKLQTLAIGLLGTYLVNLLRLALVVVVYFLVGRPLGVVFHDYFSNLMTLVWLFGFWWFAHKSVLDARPVSSDE